MQVTCILQTNISGHVQEDTSKAYVGVEVFLHLSLTPATDEGKRLASRSFPRAPEPVWITKENPLDPARS